MTTKTSTWAPRPRKSGPDAYAGLRRTYPNALTRDWVGLYDGGPAGMDTEAGRWQTVCEAHGSICSHDTLCVAIAFAKDAPEWCEDCMDIYYGDERKLVGKEQAR